MTTIILNDGNKIPAVGFGVFLIPADGPTYDAVRTALDAGYRHIDTAAAYFNEADVGRAVRDSGIPREEIFITSKLWLQDYGYEAAKKGLNTSLEKLGMDYVDLYLLHQPYGDVAGAWKALEEAKAAGKVRSIGVSNMTPKIWKEFVPQFKTLPAVNQVECNPFFQQRELRELLAKDDVKIEAYQPLGHGDSSLLSHPVIAKLAEKYGKTPARSSSALRCRTGSSYCPSPPTRGGSPETWTSSTLNWPKLRWRSCAPWTPAGAATIRRPPVWRRCCFETIRSMIDTGEKLR